MTDSCRNCKSSFTLNTTWFCRKIMKQYNYQHKNIVNTSQRAKECVVNPDDWCGAWKKAQLTLKGERIT